MLSWTFVLGWVLVLFYIKGWYQKSTKPRSPLPLPPGPPGLPWFGNVIGLNTSAPWLTYSEWAKTYGDIIYSRILGKDIIIINSEKIAKELLAGRSANYSDRPYFIGNELCGIEFNSISLPYGNKWRLHRRLFHQTFRPDAARRFLPLQHRKASQLLRRLFDTPEQLEKHVFDYTASIVLNSVYDYDPLPHEDNLVDTVSKVLEIVQQTMSPTVAVAIDVFSAILKLPSWFPGMSLKQKFALARELSREYVEKPFAYSVQKIPSDDRALSMVHAVLRNMEEYETSPDELQTNALKEAAATAFLAASDTTNSVLMTFFLMMMTNLGVQEKAQAEIDAVVGRVRLPTMNDRPSLPYVEAILRELLRFNPSIAMAAHATTDDDVYAGYHIPKGAIVLVNIWSMTRDEVKYPNPQLFLPDRFLGKDDELCTTDVEDIAFGFGRRICAGRHFADGSLWSVITAVLSVFTILKPLDENGVEIPVEVKFSNRSTVHPVPFQCRTVPRVPGLDAKKLEELSTASIDSLGG